MVEAQFILIFGGLRLFGVHFEVFFGLEVLHHLLVPLSFFDQLLPLLFDDALLLLHQLQLLVNLSPVRLQIAFKFSLHFLVHSLSHAR